MRRSVSTLPFLQYFPTSDVETDAHLTFDDSIPEFVQALPHISRPNFHGRYLGTVDRCCGGTAKCVKPAKKNVDHLIPYAWQKTWHSISIDSDSHTMHVPQHKSCIWCACLGAIKVV